MTRYLSFAVTLAVCACGRNPAIVKEWLSLWERARACMLSQPEYGPDSSTAYQVSQLTKRTKCHDERLALLSLTDEQRTSIPGWENLREEIEPLTSPYGDGVMIDRVDARVARLREVVQLPFLNRTRPRKPFLLDGGTRVEIDATGSRTDFEHDRLYTKGSERIVEVEEPNNVRSTSVPAGAVLAYPSRSWAAAANGETLTITELGETPRSLDVKLPGRYWTSYVMDRGASRLVTLQVQDNGDGFAVAHSADGGRTWKVEKSGDSLPLTRASQDMGTGAIDIVVESGGFAHLHRFEKIEPFVFPDRVDIPKFESWFDCRHNGVLWALSPRVTNRLLRVTLPSSYIFDLGEQFHSVEDCRDTSALLIHTAAFEQYLLLCRGAECQKVHQAPHAFDSAAALLDDGSWLYAAANGPIVGVWREKGAEPTFYRLAEVGELKKVRVLKGKVYLVLVVEGSYQLVSLPIDGRS